jgi:Na+-translocating ferredoxin:NAD+ oxidoreductase RnfD subunit
MRHLNGPTLRAAPLLPLISSAGRVSLVQAIALAPVLAMDIITRGPLLVPMFMTCLVVALIWENLFAFLRHADFSFHGLTTAMVVTLFAPLGVEAWQLAVAVSLGVVLGELVFGGRGFGFVNPAAAALALLVFSFPQLTLVAPEMTVALATLPGAVLLLIAGLISWRVLLATLLMALAAIGLHIDNLGPNLSGHHAVGRPCVSGRRPAWRSLHEPRSLGLRRARRLPDGCVRRLFHGGPVGRGGRVCRPAGQPFRPAHRSSRGACQRLHS